MRQAARLFSQLFCQNYLSPTAMSEANIPSISGSPESAPIAPELTSPSTLEPLTDDSLMQDVWQDWQTVDLPNAVSVDALAPASQEPAVDPQVVELIGLIQQLNECNTQLLDRIEQLEAALEHSQGDLQTEIARHQEVVAVAAAQEGTMQDQLAQLLHQLEFSHQASQRQQILVETVTEQLENSQERIAQLERECSIAQQRCGEQAQKIVEVENTCRDLQIRLQRQQRYTLQFKVALDKCLDVPAPSYEAEPMRSSDSALAVPQALLPKLASIQPWSSQPQFPELEPEENLPQLSRLRSFESAEPSAAPSYSLKPTLSEWVDAPPTSENNDAITTEDAAIDKVMVVEPQVTEETLIETIEITADMLHSLNELPPAEPSSAVDNDDLWQDLARLIEVSTDDVVKASTAADFAEFAQQVGAESDWQPVTLPTAIPAVSETSAPATSEPTLPQPAATQPNTAPVVQPSSPSPLVYPLRPTRKRESLAAVELPSFPR